MDIAGEIKRCQRCTAFGIFNNGSVHTYLGKEFDGTILVGESPHANWKEGDELFNTPSGKRILEYLKILGKTKEQIILLEAAKCVVKDRKDLPKMISNCQSFLLEQLNDYKPNTVISFGKIVADSFSEVIGSEVTTCNKYELSEFTYIPLFHPSPINPQNHKKNLEFIKNL